MSNFEHMITEERKASDKLNAMLARDEYNISSLALKIGIQRGTLYTRLNRHNWKKSELLLIKTL